MQQNLAAYRQQADASSLTIGALTTVCGRISAQLAACRDFNANLAAQLEG